MRPPDLGGMKSVEDPDLCVGEKKCVYVCVCLGMFGCAI